MSANNDSNLRRLVNSNFNRPKTTYTDTLQNKQAMQEKLKNYRRVDDIEDVAINTHVRYVTLDKEQKQVFRLGGLLKKFIANTFNYQMVHILGVYKDIIIKMIQTKNLFLKLYFLV